MKVYKDLKPSIKQRCLLLYKIKEPEITKGALG